MGIDSVGMATVRCPHPVIDENAAAPQNSMHFFNLRNRVPFITAATAIDATKIATINLPFKVLDFLGTIASPSHAFRIESTGSNSTGSGFIESQSNAFSVSSPMWATVRKWPVGLLR